MLKADEAASSSNIHLPMRAFCSLAHDMMPYGLYSTESETKS